MSVADQPTDRRDVVLDAVDLNKTFRAPRRRIRGGAPDEVRAVRNLSLHVSVGETLALVGESGSGKSTAARLLTLLERPDSGSVTVLGQEWTGLGRRRLRACRHRMQMVFQDPFSSLDPTKMVVHSVGEPMMIHQGYKGRDLDQAAVRLLDQVGLTSSALHRYPHEFSGGQRQRIAIARALAADPAIIIADEAVSALDVSTQAQVLNLLQDIQKEHHLALLFITHDLGVVRQVADRVCVLHRGEVVEEGDADDVLGRPREAYTRRLLSAVPEVSPTRRRARRAVADGNRMPLGKTTQQP